MRSANKMSGLWLVAFVLGISSIFADDSSSCKLDLGVVVDMTKSIGYDNVPILKKSLRNLVEKFDISEDGTHVSLETFAGESTLHNKFSDTNYHSAASILAFISSSIGQLYMPTRLDRALIQADKEMFTERSGHRPGVRSALVLYTDGRSHPDTEDYLKALMSLKGKGVRLVVVGIGPSAKRNHNILKTIAGENVFFVADYDVLDEATDDITNLVCPPSPCENSPGMDVAFVVDRTQSVGKANFRLLKGFLLELCDALDISSRATHTGFILYADYPEVLNTFANRTYHSKEAVHQLIADLPARLGNQTFTDRALEAAYEQLFTSQGGDRRQAPNVMIVITDGRTNRRSKAFDEIIPLFKEKKVHIAVIGVGNWRSFEDVLREIAGNNVYMADNFAELSDLFDDILAETCSVDGRFSRWSFWSKCNKPCGGGFQTRTRTCTNPPPQGYGKPCMGDLKETRQCNRKPCLKTRDSRIHRSMYGRRFPQLKAKHGEGV